MIMKAGGRMCPCNKFSLRFKTIILYAILISVARVGEMRSAYKIIHPDISGEQQQLQQHTAAQCHTYITLIFNHLSLKHLNTVNCDYLLVTTRACEMAPLCLELIILLCYFLSCKINGHCVHFSSITKVNI